VPFISVVRCSRKTALLYNCLIRLFSLHGNAHTVTRSGAERRPILSLQNITGAKYNLRKLRCDEMSLRDGLGTVGTVHCSIPPRPSHSTTFMRLIHYNLLEEIVQWGEPIPISRRTEPYCSRKRIILGHLGAMYQPLYGSTGRVHLQISLHRQLRTSVILPKSGKQSESR
jgi:hypothetical protein